jgi:hypothetical protein
VRVVIKRQRSDGPYLAYVMWAKGAGAALRVRGGYAFCTVWVQAFHILALFPSLF